MNELRLFALKLYSERRWPSAQQAAQQLQADVLDHSRSIGANMSPSNAQRTLAEWFRKSV